MQLFYYFLFLSLSGKQIISNYHKRTALCIKCQGVEENHIHKSTKKGNTLFEEKRKDQGTVEAFDQHPQCPHAQELSISYMCQISCAIPRFSLHNRTSTFSTVKHLEFMDISATAPVTLWGIQKSLASISRAFYFFFYPHMERISQQQICRHFPPGKKCGET